MHRWPFVALLLMLAATRPAYPACAPSAKFDPHSGGTWSGWGLGLANTRFVTAGAISADVLATLELRWAFGFPDVRSVMGEPAVAGNRVFIGVDTGTVYSLDADSGCPDWRFAADASVRTAPVVVEVDGAWTVFFGDLDAQVYAVAADSGALEWRVKIDDHRRARITGTPQFLPAAANAPARLFVPVASSEEGAGGEPDYPCCTFRGSVVALDAGSGARLWKTFTIEDAPVGTGPNAFGPAGAGVWSAPTVDPDRGLLYIGTGDAYSAPADRGTDAILAMTLERGDVRWRMQATADDVWTVACLTPEAPEDCGPDQDFGAPPILVTVDDGQRLIAGQKSGNVWALDPDTGAVVWRTPLVEDTTQFGGKMVWGGAVDRSKAYFGLGGGGIGAVRLSDGALQWFTDLAPAQGRASHPGQDGPLTVSGDVLFSGGWDGVLRALSTASGKVIWEYDTVRRFETVSGVEANGGSMGAAGPVVAGGRLFVPSGYIGVKDGMPGNVLLMFAPR